MDELMEWLKIILKIIKILSYILPIIIGVGGLHCILYAKSPRYYFFILKIVSRWKDTNWKLSAIFTLDKSIDLFNTFEGVLCERYGKKNYKRIFNLKNKKLYEFSNFSLTIQYDLNISQNDEVQVEFIFNTINATFNGANDMLKELRMLFNSLERNIAFTRKSYNLIIKFSSMNNPFYGLLIQRLGPEHVDYFECAFSLTILEKKQLNGNNRNDYKINVFKDCISLNETEFDIIEEIAKKCLLMG